MSTHWLAMRISEEQDRRQREALVQERLPAALVELRGHLETCVAAYRKAFGDAAAELKVEPSSITVTARESIDGQWRTSAEIVVEIDAGIPGFRIGSAAGEPFGIEVGMLPGQKLFYRRENQYLGIDDVTRHILDRALFPKLLE